MSVWDICIRRPVFTTMLMLGPVVLGIASYGRLGVELFPNVDIPVVIITTTLRGASAEEMETSVTRPIEEAVNTVAGIDELRSTTREGLSIVVIGFKLERDGEQAAQDVRDRISTLLPRLPSGTDPPVVEKFDLNTAPILTLVVSGGPGRELREVTEIARKRLKEDLESVLGVGAVILVGGETRAINVLVRPADLRARGLTVEDVRHALQAQNLELPGGRIESGTLEFGVRTLGRIPTPADFADLVITTRSTPDGGKYAIRLKDVADVEDGIEEPRGLSRLDGQKAVSLIIQKQSGANTVQVSRAVKQRLEKIRSTLPADIRVEVIRDQARFIEASINEVKFHLLLAAFLVVGVIYLFIRDWRTTLIAATAVPCSIVAAFAFMDLMGFTLNTMTLLGLILAVGIVIDDAVVVLENIFRHMEEYGQTAWEAASTATREIALAVMATTFSLVVIFAPIAFMSGLVGRFFNSFGFVVGFTVLMSLVVSFTLTPMLCARFLKPLTRQNHQALHEAGIPRGLLTDTYVYLLRWSLRHRWVIVLATLVTFASTPVWFLLAGADFLPKDDQSEFEVALRLPPGTSLAQADRLCQELEHKLRQVRGVVSIFTTIGPTDGKSTKGEGDVTQAMIYCQMIDLRQRDFSQRDAMDEARRILAEYPDIRSAVQDVRVVSSSAFKNAQLDFSLSGPDSQKLEEYAQRIVQWMRSRPDLYCDIDTNAAVRNPELQVRIDRNRAADLGIDVHSIAATLSLLVGGQPVSKYKEGSEQYDVWLRAAAAYRDRPALLEELTVPSRDGRLVELRNIAAVVAEPGPAAIERFKRQRQIAIQANFPRGVNLGQALSEMRAFLATLELPPEYRSEFLGDAQLMADSNTNFAIAFVLAFIFMYMILAAQFESFVHPITILLAVPLTIPFALISLWLLRTPLDVYAMIGMFMLFGIVKKNGILQIDYTNTLRARGRERDAAIIEANAVRLRPILMTTIMLVAAMIPIATGRGPGAASRASMAKVILGGQMLSLLLTLLVTPVAYSLWDDLVRWWQRRAWPPGPLRRWYSRRQDAAAEFTSPATATSQPATITQGPTEPSSATLVDSWSNHLVSAKPDRNGELAHTGAAGPTAATDPEPSPP
ncbi:MAG: efflux RND transporter permease subunit [Gemmataceae bacterium]|nr:efflux RND transporter permease subunit [Gemmataceae bacterium]